MKDFELRITGNDKGELSFLLLDHKTKIKTEYSHDELKSSIDNIATAPGMARFAFNKFKKAFRGEVEPKTEFPF